MVGKISKMRAKNFGVYRDLDLNFDQVTSFCGLNASGKSTIREMLEIILYDANSRDQASFIRSVGDEIADSFLIELEFTDGVVVSKIKYRSGASEWTMTKAGQVVYTNRVNDSLVSVVGVPEEIQKYLGVIIDPHTKEKLNSRQKKDRLFLIDTTGGDNYKILNSILKEERIAAASVNINKDRNAKDKEIFTLNTKLATVEKTRESLDIIEDEYIELLEGLSGSLRKNDFFLGIGKQVTDLKGMEIPVELEEVDVGRYGVLEDLKVNLERLTELNALSLVEYEEVDTGKLNTLEGIKANLEELKLKEFSISHELEGVRGLGSYNTLVGIQSKVVELVTVVDRSINVGKDIKALELDLKDLQSEHGLVLCPTCSTVIEAGETCHEG